MAKISITCPHCGRLLKYQEDYSHSKIKCPQCKTLIPIATHFSAGNPIRKSSAKKLHRHRKFAGIIALVVAVLLLGAYWILRASELTWPDRRPIGILMLASEFHSSPTNPRGWFNDRDLVARDTNGLEGFRARLLDYADHSIANLKRAGAQGVIVWDLEGEEYPHKISYIGDPRLLPNLAPEMDAVADEFFARLRNAGLRIGLTIRPQQLEFDGSRNPRQTQVLNTRELLLEKIDYARKRWGATIFYIDSSGGIRRPDELWQLRSLAAARPDILLIPEHTYFSYCAFSAPYVSLRNGDSASPSWLTRKLFPHSFRAIDVSDATSDGPGLALARARGDIFLFPAWFWNPECQLMENLAGPTPAPASTAHP